MRIHLMWASATLALVIAGCGSPTSATPAASPTPTCLNASAKHHAYVVVQHLSGASLQACVGFDGDTISGTDLFSRSRVEYQTAVTSFGPGVCQVDNEPAQFSTCFPQNQPYWSLWLETSGAWSMAQVGFDKTTFHDHDAMGWHYVQPTDPSPAPPPAAHQS